MLLAIYKESTIGNKHVFGPSKINKIWFYLF